MPSLTTFQVLSQPITIPFQSFLKFPSLLTATQQTQLLIPIQKQSCLNICLYYIISIQKNVIEDGDQYRKICGKGIGDYYLRNGMKLGLEWFAAMGAKILAVKQQECAHILYYLLYGRFASHPYINAICSHKNQEDHRKKVQKRTQMASQNTKNLYKSTFSFKSEQQQEMQQFSKDLRQTLRQKSTQFVRKQLKKHQPTTQRQSGRSPLCSFVPQRISQNQTSSIFESIQSLSNKFSKTMTSWDGKRQMRKLKFNQFFDIQQLKKKAKIKETTIPGQINMDPIKKGFMTMAGEITGVSGKINYQNYRNISNELKCKNQLLDKIRYQCSARTYKTTQKQQPLQNPLQTYKPPVILAQKCQPQTTKLQIQPCQPFLMQKSFSISQKTIYPKPLPTQQAISPASQQIPSQYFSSLLRNEQFDNKQNQQSRKHQFYRGNGFSKVNMKFKLKKYKSDYRKFMKTQLLDRIKQAS